MSKQRKHPSIAAYILPTIGEMLFITLFIVIIGYGPEMMNIDGDLGRHLTLGNYIVETKNIPTKDIFSFTKYGHPLTPHEWLADVLFAIFYQIGRLDGVVWLTAIVLAASYWLVYRHTLNLSGMPLLAVAGTLLASAASSLHWLTRPHIFTILIAAIWVVELEKVRLGIRKSWLLFPALMFVWVNLHGAFLAGIVIWIAYFAGGLLVKGNSRSTTQLIWIGGSSLVITGLNPDGFGIWRTGLGFLSNQYLVGHTAEYLPPNFQHPSTWPFLLLIVISLAVLSIGKRRMPPSHVLLIAGWTAMGLISARNIPLYAVVITPLLMTELNYDLINIQENKLIGKINHFQAKLMEVEQALKGGIWMAIVVIAVGLLLINRIHLDFDQKGNKFYGDVFPVMAVDWMEESLPEGNGFNYFPWGGYLLYRLWPEKLVFIDGQTDFYGEELTRKYEQVITISKDWEDILDDYKVTWILIPVDISLADEIKTHPGWESIYQDSTAIIFTRK